MKTRRMLIIGLDGASPDLLIRWRNDLPNISDIMNDGAWGELESTIPPITLPAWASFATGKRPESLGFFDFQKVEFNPRRTSFVQSSDWTPAVWDILTDNDLKVGVVNFPGTYPPRKVRGFMIGGFLSPSSKGIFYPASLGKLIRRITSNYRIYPDTNPYLSSERRYIDNVYEIFRDRLKVTEYLASEFDWDLFVVVFMLLDWIQHYFWKQMEPEHPLHKPDSPYRDTIKDSYKLVDYAVGQLMEKAGDGSHIMLVSDHGFGSLHGKFHVNTWLHRRGYLNWKRGFGQAGQAGILRRRILDRLMRTLNVDVATIGTRIRYRKILEKLLQEDSVDDPFTQNISNINIDWRKTRAFGFGYYNEIYVNLRERGGCVDSKDYRLLVNKIVRDLEELCTSSGFRLRAYTKERSNGRNSENAPDIVYFINDGEYVQSNRFDPKRIWESSVEKSGDHRLYGVWALKGPRINPIPDRRARIYDLAPTIYHLYGVKTPPDIDGIIMEDVIK